MPLPSSPLNQSEGIFAQLHPDGRIEIVLVKERSSVASIFVRPEEISGIVFALLFTAATAVAQDKSQPPRQSGKRFTGKSVPITSIGLVSNPHPRLETLAVSIGEVQIGFEIPTANFGELAKAFEATSVEKTGKPN